MLSSIREAALASAMLAVLVIEAGPKAPWTPAAPVERLTVSEPELRELPFRTTDARVQVDAHTQRARPHEADRDRMERRIRRCRYLAAISRVARRDVLVEIIYERNRLGCTGLGY